MTQERPDHAASVTDGLKIVGYVKNEQGHIEKVESESWQPVNEVNLQAWQEIERQVNRAREKVTSGRASCLYYYMIANQMNILSLARYTRQAAWKVLLHLHPFFFRRLNNEQLGKYATLFNIAAKNLKDGKMLATIPHFTHG